MKFTTRKSLFSIILTVLMITSMFPTTIFAAILSQREIDAYKDVPVNSNYGVFSGIDSRWSWFGITDDNLGADDDSGYGKLSAFCIDIEAHVYAGTDYTSSTSYLDLSATQKTLVTYALMYGYGNGQTKYGYGWETEYCATQTLIWIIVEGFYNSPYEDAIVRGLLKNLPNGSVCYYRIRNNSSEIRTVPSFSSARETTAPIITLQYDRESGNYSSTVYDQNGVLDAFDFQKEGVSFTKDGDYLTITTTKDSFINPVIKSSVKDLGADYTNTTGIIISGGVEFWTSGSSQDQLQFDTDIISDYDPVYAYIQLDLENPGRVEIIKTSEDGHVSGIDFHITGNGVDETITTDADGIIYVENLAVGTYIITEVSPPSRYIAPASQTVTVTEGDTATVNFHNALFKASVVIEKRDAETGEIIPLAGTKFEIYDSEGTLYDTVMTDGSGTVTITDVPYGDYTYKEVQAPPGYVVNDTIYTFSVSDQASITLTVSNVPAKGQIIIEKYGEQYIGSIQNETSDGIITEPQYEYVYLAGATFEIIAKTDIVTADGTVRYIAGEVVDRVVTDENGTAVSGFLYLGSYFVHESEPPSGFLSCDDQIVTIEYMGQEVPITSYRVACYDHLDVGYVTTYYSKTYEKDDETTFEDNDYSEIEVSVETLNPNTGDDGIVIKLLVVLLLLSCGVAVLAYYLRKNKPGGE